MQVLLSIKPKFVKEINNGSKLYEFRKKSFKRDVDCVYVYESAPTKKIVGQILIDEIIEDSPENLWQYFKEFSGIQEDEFFEYFSGKNLGYAIKIKKYINFTEPMDPYEFNPKFTPPQSYAYMKNILPCVV